MLEMNLLDSNSTIEMDKSITSTDLILNDGESRLKITLSDSNLEYLRQTLSPNGIIPDDFPMKLIMLNQLIEELDIRDKDNPDWRISKVEYLGGEDDMIQFDCKAVE